MRNAVIAACFALVGCGEVVGDGPKDAAVDAEDPCAAPNVCECTVATQSTDCSAAHQMCDETGPGRVCGCVPAYVKDMNGACVFDAAPLDSGFMDTSRWTAVGPGATVNVAAAGMVDAGEGVVNRVGMCQSSGFKQTFTMPPYELAEPFKLTVTHAGTDPNFDLPNTTQISVGVNGEFNESTVLRNQYRTESFCLGPRAYGQGPTGSPVEFQVGTFNSPDCNGTSMAAVAIDQVKLEVAALGECPPPSTVVNGDMEGGAGWTFNVIQAGTGALTANVGEAGSTGARLTTVNKCSEVTMTGTVAFAATIANPAIDVFFSGTSGARLTMRLGGKNVAILNGAAAGHKRICVPSWAAATTSSIDFFLQRASNNGCATALAKTFVVDNVTLVDDAACAPVALLDAGFEHAATPAGPTTAWGLTNGYVNDNEGSTAVIQSSTQLAHTGSRSLRLAGSHECVGVGAAGADFSILVPPAAGAAGPAIKFFANVGNANLKTTTRIASVPGPSFQNQGFKLDLPETGVYQQHVFCLPTSTTGRRMTFRFSTGDTDGGGCGPNYAEEIAFIDDVEVTTDASCPAQ